MTFDKTVFVLVERDPPCLGLTIRAVSIPHFSIRRLIDTQHRHGRPTRRGRQGPAQGGRPSSAWPSSTRWTGPPRKRLRTLLDFLKSPTNAEGNLANTMQQLLAGTCSRNPLAARAAPLGTAAHLIKVHCLG